MFDRLRLRLARAIAPKTATRIYHAAKSSRLTSGWGQTETSADSELRTSLRVLRSRSRALVRDAAFAKRARLIVVNNVIGSGIGMQAKVQTARGTMNHRVNDQIERAWHQWMRAEYCHTGGTLHFSDLERALMAQIFETGEAFVRKYYAPFGGSPIPFALELIEAERIADEFVPSAVDPGNSVRMGVEVDRFYRPVAYWIRERHPSEFNLGVGATDRYERVPASQIWHLRIVDRWPQTRGEPWLHAAARKLMDIDGYSEAEIVAARAAARYMGVIETPETSGPALGETNGSSGPELEIAPGVVARLGPGEKFDFVAPNRPNASAEGFIRFLLREIAAGVGVSYESLSRDYSQSNYSSSRLALLDDRDLWRAVQMWFIRNFREPLHREWLQQAVLAGAIPAIGIESYAADPQKYEAVRFKPRGWSWIDPTSEVEAFKEAVRAGFTTVSHVIATTGDGADLEDVLSERRAELDMMAEQGLVFDTHPEDKSPKTAPTEKQSSENAPEEQEDKAVRVVAMRSGR